MTEIKLPIMDRLIQAGYLPVHRGLCVKWTRGYYDNVWFAEQVIRANSNNKGSVIIRLIAGEPDVSASKELQSTQDVWYTDGYRGRRYNSNLISRLGAAVIRFFGYGEPVKSDSS